MTSQHTSRASALVCVIAASVPVVPGHKIISVVGRLYIRCVPCACVCVCDVFLFGMCSRLLASGFDAELRRLSAAGIAFAHTHSWEARVPLILGLHSKLIDERKVDGWSTQRQRTLTPPSGMQLLLALHV